MAAASYHHHNQHHQQQHRHPSSTSDPHSAYAAAAMAHQQAASAPAPMPAAALRRAVYVHVSDLTSAYNIDHAMLEEELTRVKREAAVAARKQQQQQQQQHGGGADRDGDGVGDGRPSGGALPGGAASSSASEAASARAAVSASTANAAGLGGVPTELDTNPSQKRLHPPRVGYNLCVLVGKVSVVVDKRRVDGSRVRLAEVEVGDETGVVSLRARDDQIDTLEEVSGRQGAVVIRNCTLELYQGRHMRLAVTKWGKLSRYPDHIASTPPPPSKINRDRNFSLIDLSKVASEMVVVAPAHPHAHAHPNAAAAYPAAGDPYHSGHQEAENQANRPAQPYASAGRRGRRPPASSLASASAAAGRPKPTMGGHYGHDPTGAGLQGPAAAGSYPVTAGLHGYGGIDPGPYLYPPRQSDTLLPAQQQQHRQQQQQQQQQLHQQHQQQHVMMQQQYEMQPHRRPLQQPPPPPPPSQAHMVGGGYPRDRMGGPPPPASAMMGPGLVAQSPSGFDSNPFGMTAANPFMSPAPPPGGGGGNIGGGGGGGGAMPTLASTGSGGSIRSDSPHGKMNPQAATFDPVAFRK